MFSFRARAEKGIARHIDASSVVGTSNFSLVRSEHAHASYPGLTQRQNDCACSAFFSCEFACSVRNGRSRERTKHLFLRILSHQWREMSFTI